MKESTLVKVYTAIQKDGPVDVGINLNHVVSMGLITDRDIPDAKLIHLRMVNGDYLNVRTSFDELLAEINSN